MCNLWVNGAVYDVALNKENNQFCVNEYKLNLSQKCKMYCNKFQINHNLSLVVVELSYFYVI